MERFIVFFIIWVCFACQKQDCYDCTQRIKIYSNRMVKGYPQNSKVKFISCGEHIDIVDNVKPIVINDTVGDTIFTYWKDTDCVQRVNLF